MAEIRNLTRNGETFYPLTCSDAVLNRDGEPLGIVNDIFDVSEYNASGTPPTLAKYSTLDLALAAVPQSKQKGGMTIRYVQTSDNKYVQYRLMSDTFSTTVTDWQGVDDEPTAGSDNLVKSGDVFNAIGYEYTPISISVTSGGYINDQGTVTSGGNQLKYSGFIPVDITKKYVVKTFSSANMCTAFYTAANESAFISAQKYYDTSGVVTDFPLNLPINTAYIRVSVAEVTGKPYSFGIIEMNNINDIRDKVNTIESEVSQHEEDITNIEDDVDKIKSSIGAEYIHIGLPVTSGGYINNQGTVTSSGEQLKYSDFIQVDITKDYVVRTFSSANMCTAFYSAANEGSFISAQQYYDTAGAIVDFHLKFPQNTAYIRVSVAGNVDKPYSFGISEINDVKGNIAEIKEAIGTDYTPIDISVNSYGYINSQGTVTPSQYERIKYSDFIPVDISKHYIVKTFSNANMCAAFYTTNNESSLIRTQQYFETGGVVTDFLLYLPSNTAYIRVSVAEVTGKPYSFGIVSLTDIKDSLEYLQSQIDNQVSGINAQIYAGIDRIGFLDNPQMFDADILFVPMYGQSYTTANDGEYKITDSFDQNVFMMSGNSPVGVGGTSILPLSTGADKELTVADFGDVFSRILKRYCWKNQDILVASFGRGSRSVMELSPNNGYSSDYHQYENLFEPGIQNAVDAASNANKTIYCPFILYLQGESDIVSERAAAATPDSWCKGDKALYKQYMGALKTSMQQTVMSKTGQAKPPVVIVYTAGNQHYNSLECGIQQAVLELCAENDDMFCVGPYYYMTSMIYHLSPDGRRWQAELFAKQIFELLIRGEETSMTIKNVTIEGRDVILNIKVPTPPLVFDTWTYPQRTNYGFMLYENNNGTLTPITISSVIIANAVNIKLETNVELTGKSLFVTYGNSTVSGGGNVRDSGTWNSYYDYETNNEGTGHIVYIPKDEQGNAIVGKKYPMQMWMPQFGISI